MKILFLFCFLYFTMPAFSQQPVKLLSFVQPLVGTSGSTTIAAVKHGEGTERLANTIPSVGLPFGMTQWTPQTQLTEKKCLAPYYYKDTRFTGIRATHWLSGSCTQDYGSFTIMPVTGKLKTLPESYASQLDHQDEISRPDYYKLMLRESGVSVEVSALARSGFIQFTMNKDDSLYILVTPNSDKDKGYVKVDSKRQEITGYNPAFRIYQGIGKPAGFSGYFIIKFQRSFSKKGTYSDNALFMTDSLADKKNIGAFAGFKLRKGEIIRLRIGTSFTSIQDARKNLATEIAGWSLAAVTQIAAAAWEKALQQVSVETNRTKDKQVFYTAMFHSMQHPRLFSNADGSYPRFAHQYVNDKMDQGSYYDDFSMWDIYRAQLPLFEILQPKRVNDFVRSVVLKGKQGGWLPIFPCWNNYTGAMIGDHATAFIASAFLKGINRYDAALAYDLMRQNAFETPSREEYLDGKGRRALTSYLANGYVPMEDGVPDAFHKNEQVSRTLEYAYDDYALAMVAKKLNKTEDYQILSERSKNYRNVFDPGTGFMRGRYADKRWYQPFDPDKKLPFITEGTSRQYSFYVPQDMPGLAQLLGGPDRLEEKLDSLFLKNEYWHGNEPGHQIPFLYNYTAAPWKTQREVNRILLEEYTDGEGGLSGNDDAGQMSAWYVFASMGFYPVDPVSGKYILSAPIFDRVVITLENGKKFIIHTKKQSDKSIYIQSVKWNHSTYTKCYFTHADLTKGGELEILLGDEPNHGWAIRPEDKP